MYLLVTWETLTQYTLRGIVKVLETFLLLHHRQNNLPRKWDKYNKESNTKGGGCQY
jgi:hypothetical protein